MIQVKGTVRDIQATPLVGVKVQCEESGESVLTDYRGTYTIKVKGNGRLIFSKKSEEVVRLLPERHVLPIRVYGKIQKNDNKNDI